MSTCPVLPLWDPHVGSNVCQIVCSCITQDGLEGRLGCACDWETMLESVKVPIDKPAGCTPMPTKVCSNICNGLMPHISPSKSAGEPRGNEENGG